MMTMRVDATTSAYISTTSTTHLVLNAREEAAGLGTKVGTRPRAVSWRATGLLAPPAAAVAAADDAAAPLEPQGNGNRNASDDDSRAEAASMTVHLPIFTS